MVRVPLWTWGRGCCESGHPRLRGDLVSPGSREGHTFCLGAHVHSGPKKLCSNQSQPPAHGSREPWMPSKQGVLPAQRWGDWLSPHPLTPFPRPGEQFSTKTRRPCRHRNGPRSQSKPPPSVSFSGQGWEWVGTGGLSPLDLLMRQVGSGLCSHGPPVPASHYAGINPPPDPNSPVPLTCHAGASPQLASNTLSPSPSWAQNPN